MSGPAAATPTAPEDRGDRKKSFGKYVKRLGSVLRRGNSRDVPAESSSSKPVPEKTKPAEVATPTPALPSTSNAPPVPIKDTPQLVPTSAGPSLGPGAYARSAIQQERARALFAKYGLTLEAHEWVTTSTLPASVQRVEKPIRMRVHRTCHKCETTFGADRVCKNCEHRRCKKCPRYPQKKDKSERAGKDKTKVWADELVSEYKKKRKSNPHPYLTITSKTGGELVYSPARQRIRRTCHKCNNLFQPVTAAVCQNCQHLRCTKCPREPAKQKKWPEGYPGDAEYESSDEDLPLINRTWKRPRQRVRWSCCTCNDLFTEGTKVCVCSHERCENCTRKPLKKPRKEFDPEVVRRVEQKLAQFKLEQRTSATEITPS